MHEFHPTSPARTALSALIVLLIVRDQHHGDHRDKSVTILVTELRQKSFFDIAQTLYTFSISKVMISRHRVTLETFLLCLKLDFK